jgi:hypothetical protein
MVPVAGRAWQPESAALHELPVLTPRKQKTELFEGGVFHPGRHAVSWPCESGGANRNKNKRVRMAMWMNLCYYNATKTGGNFSARAFQLLVV